MSFVVLGWGKSSVGNSTIQELLRGFGYGVVVQDSHTEHKDVFCRIVVLSSVHDLADYKLSCLNDSPLSKADDVVYVINNSVDSGLLEQELENIGFVVSGCLPKRSYLSEVSEGVGLGCALSQYEVRLFIDNLVSSVGNEHFPLP
ncbi:hypothetical protein [Pseudoalteromonas marina]|uniref:Uncharacterized protein n=1 Tax=Pseudoalteromonas marina TaxID=267375 RepID=A0ABT9FCD2_9GAMM|nr:hypothetical protein [Pseudoalteromonas marina]MDP2564447.1 hypothetical protein [Pseudoalteromonas marina]